MISFGYLGKAMKLRPGILSTYLIQNNKFFIEINDTMNDLLVIRTIEDGYESVLCASFGDSETVSSEEKC